MIDIPGTGYLFPGEANNYAVPILILHISNAMALPPMSLRRVEGMRS